MHPILLVIDNAFLRTVPKSYGMTPVRLNDCRLFAISDTFGNAMTGNWDSFIKHVISEVRNESVPLLLVIAHSPVFKGHVDDLEMHRPEYRVPNAEKQLRAQLGSNVAQIFVKGFHHDEHSEINRFLFKPEILKQPGSFAQLRRLMEDGGGPLGQIGVLKHELMRPFTSVRLFLQLQAEDEEDGFDAEVKERIVEAVKAGRERLAKHQQEVATGPPSYLDAIRSARQLLDTEMEEITSNPETFHGWIDSLNDALDDIRQVAR